MKNSKKHQPSHTHKLHRRKHTRTENHILFDAWHFDLILFIEPCYFGFVTCFLLLLVNGCSRNVACHIKRWHNCLRSDKLFWRHFLLKLFFDFTLQRSLCVHVWLQTHKRLLSKQDLLQMFNKEFKVYESILPRIFFILLHFALNWFPNWSNIGVLLFKLLHSFFWITEALLSFSDVWRRIPLWSQSTSSHGIINFH